MEEPPRILIKEHRTFRFEGRAATITLACLFILAAGSAPAADRSAPLDGPWLFQPDPDTVGEKQGWEKPEADRSGWRRVAVPMAWDDYDPTMESYEGAGWYALAIPGERVVASSWQRLRFGRVNHKARVWLNGRLAGENLTGYLPFELAATPFLRAGQSNWLVLRVENGTRYDWLPGTPIVEWVQYGGILEPVELLTTGPVHVAHVGVRASPRGNDGRVAVSVDVGNASAAPFAGRVRVRAAGKSREDPVRVAAGATERVNVSLVLPEAPFWSLEHPALETAHVELLGTADPIDSVDERFGIRSIEAQGRQILLNGWPVRIRGVNRYDEFPGHGPVVDEAAILKDLLAVKETGANLVRVHYPQSPAHLRIADEIGLLVMEEVPLNWWRASWHPKVPPEYENDRVIDVAEQALEQMVRRDGSHPSLVIWSMANECRTDDELGIRAMERLLRRAKALDPTRLATYVSNRRQEQNRAFALADLVAVNLYFGMFEEPLARDVSEIEERVYRPTRERLLEITRFFADKPVLLSEFGTVGVPGWGGPLRSSEDFQAAYVSAVWRAMSSVPDVAGGVVWSWADYRHRRGFTNGFPTEFGLFGLVTLDRQPKKAHAAMKGLWRAEVE